MCDPVTAVMLATAGSAVATTAFAPKPPKPPKMEEIEPPKPPAEQRKPDQGTEAGDRQKAEARRRKAVSAGATPSTRGRNQTLLTGPGGVGKDDLQLGSKTLLGQ